MTVVAVSQRTELNKDYAETRDSLDQRWSAFLAACQLSPLLIPNHLTTTKQLLETIPIQGVILTGGNDSHERQMTEYALMEFAINKGLPILGVCHGMQVIQRFFGVPLHEIAGHIQEKQTIYIQDQLTEVNSFHECGTKDTIDDLIVWARAQDGIVKAICHQSRPMVGIMWHPERFNQYRQFDIQLLVSIFNQGQRNAILSQLRETISVS